jgi:hypothetical protein
MLKKVSSNGVGYSVVDLNDVRHVFTAAVPRGGNKLEEQAEDALHTSNNRIPIAEQSRYHFVVIRGDLQPRPL